MWQLAHLATGALVGQQTDNPVIAFGLGVGVHLLIDKIPHYWPKPMSERHWFTLIDYMITLPIAYWVIMNYHHNQTGMIWGIAGSLIVDIVLVGIPWIHNGPIGQWHYRRQPHHTNSMYLLTDAAVIAACIPFLIK